MNRMDRQSLVNMAIQRARGMEYKAPHEIRQDTAIFKKHAVIMSADTLAEMAVLLPKLAAEQTQTRKVARRRQASARAGRAIKKGPKTKVPKEERKRGGRDR